MTGVASGQDTLHQEPVYRVHSAMAGWCKGRASSRGGLGTGQTRRQDPGGRRGRCPWPRDGRAAGEATARRRRAWPRVRRGRASQPSEDQVAEESHSTTVPWVVQESSRLNTETSSHGSGHGRGQGRTTVAATRPEEDVPRRAPETKDSATTAGSTVWLDQTPTTSSTETSGLRADVVGCGRIGLVLMSAGRAPGGRRAALRPRFHL